MNEEWIPILDGLYSVSNLGRVRSEDRIIFGKGFTDKSKLYGRVLKDHNNGNGYRYVTISINAKQCNKYIHRLVAEAFIPNPNKYNLVNHLDGNKANNRVENLEWCTYKQNSQHAYQNNLMPKGGDRKNAIKVINIQTMQIFDCIHDAAIFYNIKYGLLKDGLRRNTNYKNLDYLERYQEKIK